MSIDIQKIVQATLVGKPEHDEQTFIDCLKLVGSNRSPKEKELGFALLSRMVIKTSPQSLRLVQTRLANRFAQISDHFQFSGALFVREVLVRNPTAGDLHSVTVFKIILNSIDAGVQSMDPTVRSLAAELFGLRVSNQNLSLLLNTLDVLLTTKTKIKNVSNDVLQLSTLGVTSHRTSLTCLLFEVLAVSLGYAPRVDKSNVDKRLSVDRKDIIRVIEMGIRSQSTIRSAAFTALRSLCLNAKYSLIPMIGRIVSTLISELETPDVDLMKTLAFIAKTYGPITSTIHKHFYVIFTALKRPMHELDYGSHVADLLSTIIESSAGLIKPEVFVTVQKAVCEVNRMEMTVLKWKMRFSSIFEAEISAIMHPDESMYLQLLAAFLALNNEFVPSPLQIARHVVARTNSRCHHSHRLKALSDVTSRPRTTDLANVKTVKKTLILQKEETMIEVDSEEAPESPESPEDVDVEDVMEPEDVSPPPTPEVSRKKKSSESSTPVVVKKKKKRDVVVATNLLEGEASVDDILNLFDMS
ncbi:hypothetical protein CRE_23163 [Caenorhabditis remanei]|uniref:Pre-rRNA-processing protein RIX1 N-terminal domain-containing protein n=1 Tax=Caenorhabditis remanei TaxID=31234 RepID=E3NHT8_CAERE|nr:hypothetical protein CRE_23163 [Caenorhabditis remanei]